MSSPRPPVTPQDVTTVWEELACGGGTIIYLVLDGVGGLREPESGRTALEQACTPNLDRIMPACACGLHEPVAPGVTPGSGPGHLALFGYDPLRFRQGRGVLAALGIDFDLHEGDVAARVNFASADSRGNITDRRAGRIPDDENRRLCERIRSEVALDFDGRFFLETVAEHRAVLVLRGDGLAADIEDTDPQRTAVPAPDPAPTRTDAGPTAQLVRNFLAQVNAVLAVEQKANTILLRGFARYAPWPTLQQRFGLKGLCIAAYPMYRGLSRLIGMDVLEAGKESSSAFGLLTKHYGEKYDFYFVHIKGTDKTGEDGDFAGKVSVIEEVDDLLPELLELEADVVVITADHSTPAVMASHSWHPVPVLLHAACARGDGFPHFDEYHCRGGGLGLRPGTHLLGLAMGHAGRLEKFGA